MERYAGIAPSTVRLADETAGKLSLSSETNQDIAEMLGEVFSGYAKVLTKNPLKRSAATLYKALADSENVPKGFTLRDLVKRVFSDLKELREKVRDLNRSAQERIRKARLKLLRERNADMLARFDNAATKLKKTAGELFSYLEGVSRVWAASGKGRYSEGEETQRAFYREAFHHNRPQSPTSLTNFMKRLLGQDGFVKALKTAVEDFSG